MLDQFEVDLIAQINEFRAASSMPIKGWCVALSGGVDSLALLHAIKALNLREPVRALHIHHGISDFADDWLTHCKNYCEANNIALEYERVQLQLTGKGIEDAARIARYQVFEQSLFFGEVLLQGHHLNDQCETLILRLLRGSGASGLSGMPVSRVLGNGMLFRPLLTLLRHDIEQYAQRNNFSWVEDESNESLIYDRNYVRHNVLPAIAKRWPSYTKPLMRVISAAQDEQLLINDLADLDLQRIGCHYHWSDAFEYIVKEKANSINALNINLLLELSSPRRRNVMRYWLKEKKLPLPRTIQWNEIDKMLLAQHDAQPNVVWPGVSLKRFSCMLLINADDDKRSDNQSLSPNQNIVMKSPIYHLPIGRLHLSQQILDELVSHHAMIRCRLDGEYFKPVDRSRKALKKYLQEMGVPPWVRPFWPVITINHQLIWVAGLGAADSYTQQITGGAIVWNLD